MLQKLLWLIIVPVLVVVAYFAVVLKWNYATGERAGWVQKLSKKGWLCKTWEGEMAMVSLPGSTPEKFLFTVWDDKVAEKIQKEIGKRVSLQYEQKVGIPSSCFGETRYYITDVHVIDTIPLTPGTHVPTAGAPAAPTAGATAVPTAGTTAVDPLKR